MTVSQVLPNLASGGSEPFSDREYPVAKPLPVLDDEPPGAPWSCLRVSLRIFPDGDWMASFAGLIWRSVIAPLPPGPAVPDEPEP